MSNLIGQTTAAKNKLQQYSHDTHRESRQPVDEQDRITYGVISDVDEDTSQVKVRFLKSDGIVGDELSPNFLPLSTPLEQIHLLWGLLRKGLVCRIYWKGKISPRKAIIEVIGNENHKLINQAPVPNEITIGPWQIFM